MFSTYAHLKTFVIRHFYATYYLKVQFTLYKPSATNFTMLSPTTADDRKSKPKRPKWVLNKRKVKHHISKMPYRDLQFRLETQRFDDEFLETITSLEQVRTCT